MRLTLMRQLECIELKDGLAAGETPLFVGARAPWELAIAALEGSVNLPESPMEAAETNLQRGQPEPEIVVICHRGVYSPQVCQYLESIGFSGVGNLENGVAARSEQIDPKILNY